MSVHLRYNIGLWLGVEEVQPGKWRCEVTFQAATGELVLLAADEAREPHLAVRAAMQYVPSSLSRVLEAQHRGNPAPVKAE